jgi:hypothetical protein
MGAKYQQEQQAVNAEADSVGGQGHQISVALRFCCKKCWESQSLSRRQTCTATNSPRTEFRKTTQDCTGDKPALNHQQSGTGPYLASLDYPILQYGLPLLNLYVLLLTPYYVSVYKRRIGSRWQTSLRPQQPLLMSRAKLAEDTTKAIKT